MSVVTDKYRGTTKYFHAFAELVRAAQDRRPDDLPGHRLLMDLLQSGSHMGKEVGRLLGEISEDEVRAGRRMLRRPGPRGSARRRPPNGNRRSNSVSTGSACSTPLKGALRRILIDSNRRY